MRRLEGTALEPLALTPLSLPAAGTSPRPTAEARLGQGRRPWPKASGGRATTEGLIKADFVATR